VKIYTRTGDDGDTHLIGAGRVPKSSLRVDAYGSVDELNAVLGAAAALDPEGVHAGRLAEIQSDLFRIGAELATTDARARAKLTCVGDEDIARLERWIDLLDADLPKLEHFILPGGTSLAAHLHVARTVCRRAERRVVALSRDVALSTSLTVYLNRLSDLLFVMARWSNVRAGTAERPWP